MMSESRIDAIARSLAHGLPRRRLLAGLVAGLPAPLLVGRWEAAAACKRPGRKCDKNQDCCAHAECKGGECKCRNGFKECDRDCVNVDTDEKHCGRCDRKCRAGEKCRNGKCDCRPDCDGKTCGDDGCGGSCGTCEEDEFCDEGVCTSGGCPAGFDACLGDNLQCGNDPTCRCTPTTEGKTLCGEVVGSGPCGGCHSSDDCAEFGEGAFCVKTDEDSGCCKGALDNFCRMPCGA